MWVVSDHRLLLAMAVLLLPSISMALLNLGAEIPRNYADFERVDVFMNRLTSFETLLPLDYDTFPFCLSEEANSSSTSLLDQFEDFWAGDRKILSPYRLNLRKNVFCEQLCVANLGPPENPGHVANQVVQAIRNRYRHHWSIDGGLPAGRRMELGPSYFETKFTQGFPLGFIGSDGLAYVYNHLTLEIYIESVDTATDRIVRFIVQPSSIHHDFEAIEEDDSTLNTQRTRRVAEIHKPVFSCDPELVNSLETDLFLEHDARKRPQLASGRVLFTYDVKWTQTRTMQWTSRWEVYVTNSYSNSDKIHMLSMWNSGMVLLFLSVIIAVVITRFLRQSLNSIDLVVIGEDIPPKRGDFNVHRLRAVASDVFRPPSSLPMFLAVCCGTGAQLFFSMMLTVLSLYFGWFSPIQLGKLVVHSLLVFVLCGTINGYVTARLLKTFRCTDLASALALNAFGFPIFVAASLTVLKCITSPSNISTLAASLEMLLVIVGVAAPLILLGAYFGLQRGSLEFPISTNPIPRPIPKQPWFMSHFVTFMVAGIFPFGAIYVEFYFLMRSLWNEYYYFSFGFLLCVIMIAVMSEVVFIMQLSLFQLQNEDYRWWWRSFSTGGSVALYVFVCTVFSFNRFHSQSKDVLSTVLYFSYMGVISIGLFLMTGFVGVAASLWINTFVFSMKFHKQ